MPKICYKERRFSQEWLDIIEKANEIIAEFVRAGYTLTLRQLYYQFVALDIIPNTMQSYKRLGVIINDARLAGYIDWNSIEDRTRFIRTHSAWEGPSDILNTCARSFAVDKWEGQDYMPEVWIEKDALIGVIEGVCTELNIPYFSCRGSVSQSEMWGAARRLDNYAADGRHPVVIHLGDHDPSGIDMTRDNIDRLDMFTHYPVEVRRIALNMNQVRAYNPPPNPAKVTDSRYKKYVAQFGKDSWELDALKPDVIADLIRSTVLEYRDEDLWAERVQVEQAGRDRLAELARKEALEE